MNIYFDNASTTKPSPSVVEDICKSMQEDWYNPSSQYEPARLVALKIDRARKQIADYINCNPDEIYFTSGATEANNWAIYNNIVQNDSFTNLVIDTIEHPSVFNQYKRIRQENLVHAMSIPLYHLSIDKIEFRLKEFMKVHKYSDTLLVSVSLINNETGIINNCIEEIAQITHDLNGYCHVDATQALTHIPIDVDKLGIDYLSSSFHKYGGVKGIGFLYCRQGCPLSPMLIGGHQENNKRAGTENTPYIIAMGNQIERLSKTEKQRWDKMNELSEYLQSSVFSTYDSHHCPIKRNGTDYELSPYIHSYIIEGIKATDLLTLLALDGIYCSAGSACSSGENKPSRILKNLDLSEDEAKSTIRVSLCENNTFEEIDYFCERLTYHIINLQQLK